MLEKLIKIDSEEFDPHLALASINKQLGKKVSPEHLVKARELIPLDDFYNLACLESVCANFDQSFENLAKAAHRERFNPRWAWQDPDLQWIRNDPRFEKIVGLKPE